jgi:hypothetical protein
MRRTQLLRTVLAVLVLGLIAAACGGDGTPSAPSSTDDVTTTEPAIPATTTLPVDVTPAPDKPVPTTTAPPGSAGSLPPGVDPRENAQVQAALSDLAAMLGVDESTIDVVVWEEVVWSDGAIGCPQPGMAYTQALVDGTRIVLEHDGVRYAYHAAGLRDPFYCADPAE